MRLLLSSLLLAALLVSTAAAPASRRAVTKTFVNDWPVAIKLEVKRGDDRPCAANSIYKTVELPPKGTLAVELDPGDCLCWRRTANPGKSPDLQLIWNESCSQTAETIQL